MLGFGRKRIAEVFFDGRNLAGVSSKDVPLELESTIRLGDARQLSVVSSSGIRHSFDLTTLGAPGDFAAFSIRFEPGPVVQIDCLIGNGPSLQAADLTEGRATGVRFQPFFLPEAGTAVPDARGRGLSRRGLHYPGIVTPGNVSLLCVCDSCQMSFRIQSFHAGFANTQYFYCDRGIHTLTVSSYELPDDDPSALERIESQLPACRACESSFRYRNAFRCPSCGDAYIDFERFPEERGREYYGNTLFGEKPQRWSRPSAL